jgi:hypothetical protein
MELNRLEEARGYNPRLSPLTMESPTNSAASSFKRGRGRPRKDEASVKKRKVVKANVLPPPPAPQQATKKREPRVDKVAKQASLTTPDAVVPRSRSASRSSTVVSERTARKLQRSATKPKPKKVATTTTRPVRGKKNRPKKSSEKDVGDRCYARWLNKQYYWGKITEIVAKDNQIFYTASTYCRMYAFLLLFSLNSCFYRFCLTTEMCCRYHPGICTRRRSTER